MVVSSQTLEKRIPQNPLQRVWEKQIWQKQIWQKVWAYGDKTYRCLTQNPRLFLMRKLARFEHVRDWVCQSAQPTEQSYSLSQSAILIDRHLDTIINSIDQHGYYLGLQLPPQMVQDILDYAHTQPCYGDRQHKFFYSEKAQLEARLRKPLQVGCYMDEACPAVLRLVNDPGLLAIAARYLGTDPVYVASELMWSFPGQNTWTQQLKAAQVFHYDLDDYRSIKFFFYLTDVDQLSGPHICIRGTHRRKSFLHQLLGQRCASIPDEKLIEQYGTENVTTICGQAGFGFVEDVCCFHKGSPPQQKERLMLQIEYAMHDYGNIRAYQ